MCLSGGRTTKPHTYKLRTTTTSEKKRKTELERKKQKQSKIQKEDKSNTDGEVQWVLKATTNESYFRTN